MWSENARVGEFRLRERQFRGSASSSWLAEALTTGDSVRLANLDVPPALEGMREPILRAIREALERGDRLRDVGVVPGTLQVRERTLTMVTPCPDGPTLREKIRSRWPEGLPLQLAVAGSLANVVACAHEHDLNHGFLTPENIYLTPEGRVQVVEWGVHAPGIGSVWPGPQEGSDYWPRDPQVAADPQRRDLYALGVILYEIFTGATPPVDTAPGAAERLGEALPDRLPRSLPPRIVAAILQEKEGEAVTARQLAVQLTFARSWVRAVAHGEPMPDLEEEAEGTPGRAWSADGSSAPGEPAAEPPPASTNGAGHTPVDASRAPVGAARATVEAPPTAVETPRPRATVREAPVPVPAPELNMSVATPALPPARPSKIERLLFRGWWTGLASGLLVALALAGGLYAGLKLGTPEGADMRPESAVRGSMETARGGGGGAAVSPGAPLSFGFEEDVQGWKGRYAASILKSVDDAARDGENSMRVRLLGVAPKSPGEISVIPPPSLGPGDRFRAFVMVPYKSMHGLTAKLFVQDATWFWTDGGITRLTPGVWTPLTVSVPEDAKQPLSSIGLRFEQWGSDIAWSGRVYVDAVREVGGEE
jgi:serine/threonine protein kinase